MTLISVTVKNETLMRHFSHQASLQEFATGEMKNHLYSSILPN